jgi:N-methylhydantoinase B
MLGGSDGVPHRYTLLSAGRPDRPLKTKEVGIRVRPGDVLDVRSAGGGGFGDPADRTPEARARDRRLGFVSGAADGRRDATG